MLLHDGGQVLAGDVVITHIGGETGQMGRLETLTVMVRRSSDDDDDDDSRAALVDVPVSIAPLDNSPPRLLIGSHLVAEAEDDTPVSLGPEVISAEDRDTSLHRLMFFVTQTPLWGRLEKRLAPMSRRGLNAAFLIPLVFCTNTSKCGPGRIRGAHCHWSVLIT